MVEELIFRDKGDGAVEDGREWPGGLGAGFDFRIERSVVTGTEGLADVKTGMSVEVEMDRFPEFEIGRFVEAGMFAEFEMERFVESESGRFVEVDTERFAVFEMGRFVEVEIETGRFVDIETDWLGGIGAGRVLGDKTDEDTLF